MSAKGEMKTFGERYLYALARGESAGLTKSDIARRCGVRPQMISRAAKEPQAMSHGALVLFAAACGIEAAEVNELRYAWYRERCVAAGSAHRGGILHLWEYIDESVPAADRTALYEFAIDYYMKNMRTR